MQANEGIGETQCQAADISGAIYCMNRASGERCSVGALVQPEMRWIRKLSCLVLQANTANTMYIRTNSTVGQRLGSRRLGIAEEGLGIAAVVLALKKSGASCRLRRDLGRSWQGVARPLADVVRVLVPPSIHLPTAFTHPGPADKATVRL